MITKSIIVLFAVIALAGSIEAQLAAQLLPGFQRSPFFAEQVLVARPADGVRVVINAPAVVDAEKPVRIVFFATPNGSSIEQTLGCAKAPGLDWHYGIQHIAAQFRRLREITNDEILILACIQTDSLSWPDWRRKNGGGGAGIRKIVQEVLDRAPGKNKRITLSSHSGGGSFIWGYIEHGDPIPEVVDRIIFLDANYSFDDKRGHGNLLLDWLNHKSSQLIVIAYDDREITYKGKKVLGPTGGTFRTTQRMFDCFDGKLSLNTKHSGAFEITTALDGCFTAYRHGNPDNRILHSELVGAMNGFLHSLTLGTKNATTWGRFGGLRAYGNWIQTVPGSGWCGLPSTNSGE